MCTFLRTLTEKNTIIGDYTDWVTVKMTKACDESSTVTFFEFVETRAVEYTTQDMVHIKGLLMVNWNDTVQFVCVKKRLFGPCSVVFVLGQVVSDAEVGHDRPADLESVLLGLSKMIRYT
jgi:hypothetical protein